MRRLNLLLLSAIRLAGARSPGGFSIHEDLLAFPQFEVIFSDDYISEQDANAILDRHNQYPTYSADFAQSTLDQTREADDRDNDATDAGEPGLKYTYELMKLPPHQYLCSIPVIQPPSTDDKTANELAKAEEARELSRATTSGWDLVAQIEDSCLYFMSGWWSYSFCKNREIVQFHALPSVPNGQPPKRDPNTAAYVLGQTPTIPATAAYQARQNGEDTPPPAELQVKGEQRYLVQRLEGGTQCDLTGRDRTIEVQYHCVPGLKNDRIGWIKEVTICAYLMVVNTPRLCNDVAFLPPDETRADPINCQLIVGNDATPPLLDQEKTTEEFPIKENQEQQQSEGEATQPAPAKEVNVGGVIVGARKVLSGADEAGKPPAKLMPPVSYFPKNQDTDGERFLITVAKGKSKDDGGEVTSMSDEDLVKQELKPDVVEDMIEEMRKLAGDSGWKLELVELPGDLRELRGYIDEDDKAAADSGGAKDTKEQKKEADDGSEEKFFKNKDEL